MCHEPDAGTPDQKVSRTEMMRALRAGWMGAAVAALVAAACSTARPASEPAARPQPAGGETAGAIDYDALYRARQDSARMRFIQADVEFMTGMIGHHAQALVMCGLAPTHGASAVVQRLCSRIINAQRDEIATMERWLRDRGQPVPEVHITGTTMMIHGGAEHAMNMPGMLTPAQMEELDRARGAEFDRLFLTYMIQHHQGAVTMVEALFSAGGAGQDEAIFKIASDIQVDQTTEIARMEQLLASLGAGSGAY